MKFEKKMKDIKILSHSAMETEAAGMLLAGYLEKNDFVGTLMGDKVEPRREFIEENAKYVQNLDI